MPPSPETAQATIVTDRITEEYHNHPEHPAHSVVRHTKTVQLVEVLTEQHKGTPPLWEIMFGLLVAAGWLILFASGAFVPTQAARTELLTGKASLTNFAIVVGCYTVTNLLFLSILASLIGCLTCRWRVTSQVERLMSFYTTLPAKRVYFAAALRGFFLYLTIISGFLVMATEDSVLNTGFAQYIRVAGITSIFGFLVGYDPQVVYRLMGKVSDLANKPLRPGEGRGQ